MKKANISFKFRPKQYNDLFQKLSRIGFSFYEIDPYGELKDFVFKDVDYVHQPKVAAIWNGEITNEIKQRIGDLIDTEAIEDLHIYKP
ncbi:hypothetical protein IKG64_01160 [Candidatus Saccharibacteria bacterium]|nr:hypothetical protein [Candidatus Saccharibacteria bacterium]